MKKKKSAVDPQTLLKELVSSRLKTKEDLAVIDAQRALARLSTKIISLDMATTASGKEKTIYELSREELMIIAAGGKL
ncbi:hypothetical protein [Desulfurivibrio sp. C05AmB]|uniref:hypothetical protein n=1 Tax=Desulfurivibrio sp. C05AmB TaxID=3374371 RepID=UPI00376F1579